MTIDRVFGQYRGEILGSLIRGFGTEYWDLAENGVQEAMLRAASRWPVEGTPIRPAAWLTAVARNFMLDQVRADRKLVPLEPLGDELASPSEEEAGFDEEIRDARLRLAFACAHPSLAPEARVALTLQTVCGLSISEIASAYLAEENTIAQRLARAKKKIRESGLRFEIPEGSDIEPRLRSVLDVIYLIFNEGYSASSGDALIRPDLTREALRLSELLTRNPVTDRPETRALFALMLFHESRSDSRVDPDGTPLTLEEQDRSTWDQGLIERGIRELEAAMRGRELSRFHLEAGIAAAHACAPSFAETPWGRILEYYRILKAVAPNPIHDVNSAVIRGIVDGPSAGLRALEPVLENESLRDYPFLHATHAELLRKAGHIPQAVPAFDRAIRTARTEADRRYLAGKRELCLRTLPKR